jgi:hypothetical protein
MNSIRLSLGKNTAVINFGKSEVDGKSYLSLAADGACNKLAYGKLGSKMKEARCDDEEPLLLPMPAKGFTVYWAVENHEDMEVIRVTVDPKARTAELAVLGPSAADGDEENWIVANTANLDIFPNPEYKLYNYRSELAAKPLNAPKRPRGRPRKPAAETA